MCTGEKYGKKFRGPAFFGGGGYLAHAHAIGTRPLFLFLQPGYEANLLPRNVLQALNVPSTNLRLCVKEIFIIEQPFVSVKTSMEKSSIPALFLYIPPPQQVEVTLVLVLVQGGEFRAEFH